jgi:hypothetical protein
LEVGYELEIHIPVPVSGGPHGRQVVFMALDFAMESRNLHPKRDD